MFENAPGFNTNDEDMQNGKQITTLENKLQQSGIFTLIFVPYLMLEDNKIIPITDENCCSHKFNFYLIATFLTASQSASVHSS